MLAQGLQWNESLTAQSFLIDFMTRTLNVSQTPRDLQARSLNLRKQNHYGLWVWRKKSQKLENVDLTERVNQDEVAGHTLTLLKIIRSCGTMDCDGTERSTSPMHENIQHFKDLNRCGRILLADGAAIPLRLAYCSGTATKHCRKMI
jgi:hypothetical protein